MTLGWIVMKCGTHVHAPLTMNYIFAYCLTFHLMHPSGKNFNLPNSLVHNQIFVNLIDGGLYGGKPSISLLPNISMLALLLGAC